MHPSFILVFFLSSSVFHSSLATEQRPRQKVGKEKSLTQPSQEKRKIFLSGLCLSFSCISCLFFLKDSWSLSVSLSLSRFLPSLVSRLVLFVFFSPNLGVSSLGSCLNESRGILLLIHPTISDHVKAREKRYRQTTKRKRRRRERDWDSRRRKKKFHRTLS